MALQEDQVLSCSGGLESGFEIFFSFFCAGLTSS